MFAPCLLLLDRPEMSVHTPDSDIDALLQVYALYLSVLSPLIDASALVHFHSFHTHISLVRSFPSVPLLAATIVNASLVSSLIFLLSILPYFYHRLNSHQQTHDPIHFEHSLGTTLEVCLLA